jgi:hypothetical protein
MYDSDPHGVTQTQFAVLAEDGSFVRRGNCLQAAVATYFGFELEDVFNFADWYGTPMDRWWYPLFLGFFAERGFALRLVGLSNKPIPQERCILTGPSPRPGLTHAVVGEHGEIVWDPHPDRTGLARVQQAWVPESLMEMRATVRAWEDRLSKGQVASEQLGASN